MRDERDALPNKTHQDVFGCGPSRHSTKFFLCLLCVLIFISLFRNDEELFASNIASVCFGAFAFFADFRYGFGPVVGRLRCIAI